MADVLLGILAYILIYGLVAWFAPATLKPVWWVLVRLTYRFSVHHTERMPRTGAVLVVANHSSYIDWLLAWLASPRRMKFVLYSGYYRNPVLRFFLSFVRHYTIRIDNRKTGPHAVAEALDAVVAALDAGNAVVIFPEGRLTRNGHMRPFGRGLEHVLKKCAVDVQVVPLGIRGMWGSIYSHKGGRILLRWPENWRRRVSIIFGQPQPCTTTAAEARAALSEALADLAILDSDHDLLTPHWYVHTASRWRNMFRPGLVDVSSGTERVLKIGEGLVACWALSGWLRGRLHSPPFQGGG